MVTARQLQKWTDRDKVKALVREYVVRGWPTRITDPNLLPYVHHREELSTSKGCVLWGSRVIVPSAGREAVMKQLHQSQYNVNESTGVQLPLVAKAR